jgi:hypothetical protein
MITTPVLTRDQLSKFLPSQEAIKFFENLIAQAFRAPSREQIFPIGSIHIRVDAIDPAVALEVGTWELLSKARALVGYDPATPGYDTVEATGGAYTVTLDPSEMPVHTHTQNAHNHTQDAHAHTYNDPATAGGAVPATLPTVGGSANTGSTTATNQATTATNQNTGGGGAHNNVSPYMVFAIWKRTA